MKRHCKKMKRKKRRKLMLRLS
jgi:hypothetical protein